MLQRRANRGISPAATSGAGETWRLVVRSPGPIAAEFLGLSKSPATSGISNSGWVLTRISPVAARRGSAEAVRILKYAEIPFTWVPASGETRR